MQEWHAHDEGEEIVDEGVERLVHERPPRQVRHRLELIVDDCALRKQTENTKSRGRKYVHSCGVIMMKPKV